MSFNRQEWLKSLKVGDDVLVEIGLDIARSNGKQVTRTATITRVRGLYLHVGDIRLCKRGGSSMSMGGVMIYPLGHVKPEVSQ
jgi:hypothetical protein